MKPPSERQLQLIQLAATGLTDKEIAKSTGLAIGTLRTYWDRLRQRYGCKNRAEVIAKALLEKVSGERSVTILDALPLFIWKTDADGSICYRNAWFEKASLSRGEADCKTIDFFVDEKERLAHDAAWREALAAQRSYEMLAHLQIQAEDKRQLHKLKVFPVKGKDGTIDHWIGYGRELAEDADDQMLHFLTKLMAS